ncbi:right-handed parallel beta-helix repeat-containing protein [Meiothermus sp.]|uniref:right-handed parallel beta-helix repeat-containing protein n=1 Tax=Meiothermus sp. TaxID=1955249 RepID=UPI00307D215E
MRTTLLWTALLAIGGGAMLAYAQSPRTINVARNANLAQVVASAPAGSTLRLAVGEYRLSAGLNIGKSLNLVGAGRDRTRIFSEAGGFVLKFAPQNAAKLSINGLSVEHRGNRVADVMQIEGGEVVIENARFTGAVFSEDDSEGGDGLYVIDKARDLTIRKSEFVRNQLNGLNHTAGKLTVQDSVFSNNQNHGLVASEDIQALLERNTARGNRQSGIVIGGGNATLRNNVSENNQRNGIVISEEASAVLERNTARGNLGWGIFVEDGAKARLGQNSVLGNREGQIRTEPPFNPNLKPGDNLNQALRRAPAGATVNLAAGTYVLEGSISLEKPLTLIGAGRDQTRLVSNAGGVLSFENQGKLVIRGISLEAAGNDPEVDILTISKGEFELSDCRIRGLGGQSNSESGDGIYITEARGSIQNCDISEHSRHGIYLSKGQLRLSDSSVSSNGRIGILAEGNLTARNIQVSSNQEDGLVVLGELQVELSSLTLKGNGGLGMRLSGPLQGSVVSSNLEDNLLGGLQVEGLVQANLENNTVQNNQGNGVILRGGSRPTLRNNTIQNNALHGIALLGNGQARLENNTIANNQGYGILRLASSQALLGTNTLQNNRLGDTFQR